MVSSYICLDLSLELILCLKFHQKTEAEWLSNIYVVDEEFTFDDVADLVRFMRDEWQVLSVTDLVYNHTANDSEWLLSHPDSAYNLLNSPHLRPAYLIDRLLYYTSQSVASGELKSHNIPPQITSHDHVNVSVNLYLYIIQYCIGLRVSVIFIKAAVSFM